MKTILIAALAAWFAAAAVAFRSSLLTSFAMIFGNDGDGDVLVLVAGGIADDAAMYGVSQQLALLAPRLFHTDSTARGGGGGELVALAIAHQHHRDGTAQADHAAVG